MSGIRIHLLITAAAIVAAVTMGAVWLRTVGISWIEQDHCGVAQLKREWRANPALLKCAAANDGAAQAFLGMLYWQSSATENFESRSDGLDPGLSRTALQVEGRRLLEAGARKGVCEAHNELGHSYLAGVYGSSVDLERASEWLRSGDRCGDVIAPYNLARMRYSGTLRDGDSSEAMLWRSAQRGYKPAFCTLAHLYDQSGDGISALALRFAATIRSGWPCTTSEITREFLQQ